MSIDNLSRFNIKLYQKITLVIFIMVLITAFSLFFGSRFIFQQTFEDTVKKRVAETLDVMHSMIEEYHHRAKSALGMISFNRDFSVALKAENIAYINEFLQVIQNNMLLSIIEVFSEQGRLLTRVEGKGVLNETYHTSGDSILVKASIDRLQKFCDIEYVNGALQIKAVIPVVEQSTFDSIGSVVITYPINNYFADQLRCITNTDVLIFKPSGELAAASISNTSGERVLDDISYDVDEFATRHSKLPDFILDRKSGDLVRKYCTARFNNGSYGIGFSKVYKSDGNVAGIIACSIPLEKLYEARYRTANFLLKLLGIIVILVLLISFAFSNTLTKPLKVLTNRAKEVKGGMIEEFNIPVESHDEIGILTDTFNQMTYSLKIAMTELTNTNKILDQRLLEIQILYDISQSINFIADTHELLAKILQKTVEAVAAHHASIMLLNDTTDELEVKLIQGIAPHKLGDGPGPSKPRGEFQTLGGARLKSNAGIAGSVFASGKPLIINSAADHPDFVKLPDSSFEIRNMICVPLIANNKPYGVINVVNKGGGEPFNENDLRVITSIANQISLILEKAKLYEQSITDGMTGLYIHRYFQARLDEEIIRARRYGSTLSLVMMDIDHFKNFNDSYGHQMGDKVLIGVADTVKTLIRSNIDIPARYGGEEFTIILPATDTDGAFKLADRIRHEISRRSFDHDGKNLNVTISMGIASYPGQAGSKVDLIARADIALYKSKESGRNRVSIYDERDGGILS